MQFAGQGAVVGGALLQLQDTGVVLALLQDAMISGFQDPGLGPILPKPDATPTLPEGPHREAGSRRDNYGPAGETHGTDGNHHYRFDAGMQNRATGSHGVAGRTGRGGNDQAITAILINDFTVNRQLQAAGGGHVFKAGPKVKVVEGPMDPIAFKAGLQHHATVNREAIFP
jgi:hypothetical protein